MDLVGKRVWFKPTGNEGFRLKNELLDRTSPDLKERLMHHIVRGSRLLDELVSNGLMHKDTRVCIEEEQDHSKKYSVFFGYLRSMGSESFDGFCCILDEKLNRKDVLTEVFELQKLQETKKAPSTVLGNSRCNINPKSDTGCQDDKQFEVRPLDSDHGIDILHEEHNTEDDITRAGVSQNIQTQTTIKEKINEAAEIIKSLEELRIKSQQESKRSYQAQMALQRELEEEREKNNILRSHLQASRKEVENIKRELKETLKQKDIQPSTEIESARIEHLQVREEPEDIRCRTQEKENSAKMNNHQQIITCILT